MACQGRCRVAVRSTLYKACEVKYSTYREEGTVGVRCTRTESTVFTGFSVGIHELFYGGVIMWKVCECCQNTERNCMEPDCPAFTYTCPSITDKDFYKYVEDEEDAD